MARPARVQAPTPPAAPGTESTPAVAASIRNLRQGLSIEIAYHEERLGRLRRADAGFYEVLARLGQALPDDPVVQAQIRLVQGLDDVRGQVETLNTRGERVEELLSSLVRQIERLAAEVQVYTIGVADLGGGLGQQLAGYQAETERARVAEGICIAGVNETQRRLIEICENAPALTANAVAVAVGSALAPVSAEAGTVPVVYLVPARATVAAEGIHLVPEPEEAAEVGAYTGETLRLDATGRRRRTG